VARHLAHAALAQIAGHESVSVVFDRSKCRTCGLSGTKCNHGNVVLASFSDRVL